MTAQLLIVRNPKAIPRFPTRKIVSGWRVSGGIRSGPMTIRLLSGTLEDRASRAGASASSWVRSHYSAWRVGSAEIGRSSEAHSG